MLDFLIVSTRSPKRGVIEIFPYFRVKKSSDLMIRGNDFYAIWDEERKFWSTDEDDAVRLIDNELRAYYYEHKDEYHNEHVKVLYLEDSSSGMIDAWHKYCQKQLRDNFHPLDENLIFSNMETKKTDYATKKLEYSLCDCETPGYDTLMSILYTPEERRKIEWAIGAIVSGDSKHIQKFLVLYGPAGTGKSTVLTIIEQLFNGYYSVFDAKALGTLSNAFALEAFKTNPLVAIQHDGDLSRIEDNTRLNSLVSHELMTVNEKFKPTYPSRFKSFLFMGTNRPVKITDAKSGLIRRLIDVYPSGDKLPYSEYRKATDKIKFELGGIAKHCLDVYLDNPEYYDAYTPTLMMGASNDFYNFVFDAYFVFKKENSTTLKTAWEMYKTYNEEAKVAYPYPLRAFKEELKNYFRNYEERHCLEDGTRIRNYYSDFRFEKFSGDDNSEKHIQNEITESEEPSEKSEGWIKFSSGKSIFDDLCKHEKAQYATKTGGPGKKWDSVKTTLESLDTSRVHYVQLPDTHIVIDFDITDDNGEKSLEKNLEAANKWPETYAELSKSGKGIHLHYIYNGDPSLLSRIYGDSIEIKVFTGNSSLRRCLTKCYNHDISTISSGLPLRRPKKVLNYESVKSEKALRNMIIRNLNKEIHPYTKPSVDFIYKLLEDAYESGMHYDVTDLRPAVLSFAVQSSNQAQNCVKLVTKMKFMSDEPAQYVAPSDDSIVFFDTEVFPNLFLICWKRRGPGNPVVRMYNPSPAEVEALTRFALVGFNNLEYDNNILYARMMGYTNEELFELSTKLINNSKNATFYEARNLSYTDVLDFASALNKKSLKKWEIELGIHHQELGFPFDKPIDEKYWDLVGKYCDNDVMATEAVFEHLSGDWAARKILARVTNRSYNDKTNALSTALVFGGDKNPQASFNYRNMGDETQIASTSFITKNMQLYDFDDGYTAFDKDGRPIFPGYTYSFGVSKYRGEVVGEGGYVFAIPGAYINVALLDVASMHPSSIIAEQLFGPVYTKRFQDIKDARIAIKHGDYAKAKTMLGGALREFIEALENGTADYTADDLALALKTAINSVYGLTCARFENKFKDKRNVDNIVAKRGALFMINLKHEVQKRGYTVAHIKTDSIKIPNADSKIIEFVMDYGEAYGYEFEHEETYDRMCLVNDAVYIAKYKTPHKDKKTGKDIWWTATGTQFAVPYVFKTLFSKEPTVFKDFCETKSVSKGAMYLDMNEKLPDVSEFEKELSKLESRFKKGKVSESEYASEKDILLNRIKDGHNHVFVGRVGQFCPVKPGFNGGILVREVMDASKKERTGFASVTGTSNFRWLESETVATINNMDMIDLSYYRMLADNAIDAINDYVKFDWFVSGATSDFPPYDPNEIPF